jgi:hypothetical protein
MSSTSGLHAGDVFNLWTPCRPSRPPAATAPYACRRRAVTARSPRPRGLPGRWPRARPGRRPRDAPGSQPRVCLWPSSSGSASSARRGRWFHANAAAARRTPRRPWSRCTRSLRAARPHTARCWRAPDERRGQRRSSAAGHGGGEQERGAGPAASPLADLADPAAVTLDPATPRRSPRRSTAEKEPAGLEAASGEGASEGSFLGLHAVGDEAGEGGRCVRRRRMR